MGAWGVGMRANDTALDALGDVTDEASALAALKREVAEEEDCWDSRAKSVLGVAEYMVDKKYKIPSALLKQVKACVESELEEHRLEDWVHDDERKDALERFASRLDGKKVDKIDVAVDNMPLLSRLATAPLGRKALKELLKDGEKSEKSKQAKRGKK
jgi:hypothetical protein